MQSQDAIVYTQTKRGVIGGEGWKYTELQIQIHFFVHVGFTEGKAVKEPFLNHSWLIIGIEF
jgi:hypothetical protein